MDDFRKWIGIDGGGTGTQCMLGDQNGRVLAVSTGPSSNIQSKPLREVKEVLLGLIGDVLDKAETEIEQLDTVYLALAGGDRPTDKRRISSALQSLEHQHVQIVIDNDAMAALSAGTEGWPGLVLIAGTGSIAYAYPPSTKELTRVGGWGYLLGDEGSGYDIGRAGLGAVLKHFDGRGPKTLMTEMLMDKMGISNPSQIITGIYGKDNVRIEIANSSKVVFQASKQGDSVARKIIDEAIEQLISLVATAKASTAQQTDSLPLVVSGGLFQDEIFRIKFDGEVHRRFDNLPLIYPSLPPVAGAFILALRHSGENITDKLKIRMENSWAEFANKA